MPYFGKVSLFLLTLFLISGCNETTTIKPEEQDIPQPTVVRENTPTLTTPKPSPITTNKAFPRISIVAPAQTYIDITVKLDNNLVCHIDGLIDANTHNPYQTRYFVGGACANKAIKTQGTHSYQLNGYITLPNGTKHDVNVNTHPVNLQDVYEPLIDIQPNGKVQLELAVS